MIGEQFYQWLENSWGFQEVWEKGMEEKNKISDVQYNMTYEQFRIMGINKLEELQFSGANMPAGIPIFGGINDEPMST